LLGTSGNRSSRNVKRWHTGGLGLRWTAAGMLEAERRFRVIVGFSDLARLAVTVERELTRALPNRVASQEAAIVASA
jgi:putative transposase